MKKHFLRALVVLLMACLGVGVLAACGEDPETPKNPENPEDPAPPATATIEGYWTGASFTDANNDTITYTASVKVEGDEAYAVVVATVGTYSYYYAKIFDKQTDGSYKLEEAVSGSSSGDGTHTSTTVNYYTYTGKLDADGKLVVTIPGALVSSTAGEEVTLNFTEKTALPAGISPTGTLYPTTVHIPVTFDFTNKKVIEGTEELTGPKFVNVSSYVVIGGKISMTGYPEQTLCFGVLQKESKYYVVGLDRYGYTWELTDTKPVAYSVVFSLGDPSHALPGEEETLDGYYNRDVGEDVYLSNPAAEEGWRFDGWYTKNGEKVEEIYIIDPDDADGTTITLTARWNVEGYTTDYNVQAQILQWGVGTAFTRTVKNGTKVTVEATVTGGIADVYAGLLMDVNMNDDWYRLRMDTAAFTYGGNNSWNNPGGALNSWQASYTSGSIDAYKGMDSAIIVAEAALSDNVLTYTVSVYAATDTEHETPIVVTTHTVTSSANVTELALNFYFDPAGNTSFAVSAAKVTYPIPTVAEDTGN